MFVHGQADSSFDWQHHPFFLRFKTDDGVERKMLFRELCEKIGVAAETYLADVTGRAAN